MLGFLLIYFLGRSVYRLAERYGKNKWLHAVISVLAYYLGTAVAGVVFYLVAQSNGTDVDDMSDMAVNLAALPVGLLFWWLYKLLLRQRWERSPAIDTELLDADLMTSHRDINPPTQG